ncbi:phage protein [bacterium endosymbiont of Mortierella elongata FMR23-6]|nr:phage protein [bacterium endosymbiont of Mortierella elongata FMR23-6]
MPFRSTGWGYYDKENNPGGNIFVSDIPAEICTVMRKTRRKVICIDDSNYVMSNAFLRRAHEKGYDKFTEMANDIYSIFTTAAHLAPDVRVYIFGHTQQTEDGIVRFKTIGKLLDEKVSLDGLVTICLRTVVRDGTYCFATRNNGSDTVKAPIDLFSSDLIENDLSMIDAAITEFYALNPQTQPKETRCIN